MQFVVVSLLLVASPLPVTHNQSWWVVYCAAEGIMRQPHNKAAETKHILRRCN